ncbi:multisubunit Na+/H+ antiporter, MnhE subunit [Thioflavicoccus mobilis 8321]|uniref:Multisubunit Na+/H+ antiporter, MnhE subunit n=1 Tax=Thioflavicoccus mobilis 8321 TaxID=765912 RepID=L0GZ26_9GAMM|nr:Na+/H+ antiporter subunit E [Thioflavicoccus mobilis]AGA90559.1 multisubunit Na+/H+ antiporter, MnhE subunit [Thioflavicoccus mobilis 8321]
MHRWLPHPLTSATIVLLWLFLVNQVSVAQGLLGAVLGVVIPYLTSAFWPQRPRLRRPWALARYLVRLLGDIVIANLEVARLVLGPTERLRPAFVEVPLELTDDFAITFLAAVVSLTPGSLSADIAADRTTLLVHVLDTDDPEAQIAEIKARYEAPLKEIFG